MDLVEHWGLSAFPMLYQFLGHARYHCRTTFVWFQIVFVLLTVQLVLQLNVMIFDLVIEKDSVVGLHPTQSKLSAKERVRPTVQVI